MPLPSSHPQLRRKVLMQCNVYTDKLHISCICTAYIATTLALFRAIQLYVHLHMEHHSHLAPIHLPSYSLYHSQYSLRRLRYLLAPYRWACCGLKQTVYTRGFLEMLSTFFSLKIQCIWRELGWRHTQSMCPVHLQDGIYILHNRVPLTFMLLFSVGNNKLTVQLQYCACCIYDHTGLVWTIICIYCYN